jgi:hypothetical protein
MLVYDREKTARLLERALDDAAPEVRAASVAAFYLLKSSGRELADRLKKRLSRLALEKKVSCSLALAELGKPPTDLLDTIRRGLRGTPAIRFDCIRALEKFKGRIDPALPELRTALKDRDINVRTRAADLLAERVRR